MSFISWLTEEEPFGDSAVKERDRQPRRRPIRSRLCLECLEARTLLDAAFGLVGGGFHNLNLNSNFNFASSANILPIPGYDNAGTSLRANGADPQHALNFSGLASSGSGAEAASSSFFAQDQLYSQFRAFGANSEGEGSQLFQQVTANILRDAYGFGSGSQPNAPWKPNAYNLGLANHQFNYSTQTDNGFSSVSPQSARVAQSPTKEQNSPLKQYQLPSPNPDEEAIQPPEQLAARLSLREQEQSKQDRQDEDVGEKNDDLKELLEQQTSEKKPVEMTVPVNSTLPDSLWLSALAPAPMAALVAGLPGLSPAAEGGDAGLEGVDSAEGAPE